MKVYTIGRDLSCNIIIDDRTDVISRRHASLSVDSSGKMTITDLSYNGTYVNGIRIAQNVPVPVTRNDNVSFAHVAQLDWNLVPNTRAIYLRYAIFAVLAVLIVIGGIFGYNQFSSENAAPEPTNQAVEIKKDSTTNDEAKKKAEELAKEEKRKQDSIKKHVEDSIAKINKAKQAAEKKKDEKTKKDKGDDQKPKKAEEPKVTRRH